MEDTKRARTSLGIWGSLAVLITFGAQQAGLDLDQGKVTEWLLAGSTFVGGAVALYGRWRAKSEIKGV